MVFGPGINADQLWFKRSGSNLEIDVIGTNDKTTIFNWYGGSAYYVDQFRSGDGRTLYDAQVDALVAEMAAVTAPVAGQIMLSGQMNESLSSIIAYTWQ